MEGDTNMGARNQEKPTQRNLKNNGDGTKSVNLIAQFRRFFHLPANKVLIFPLILS